MSNKKVKVSLILNIIIFILVVVATIIMFTGFKFMKDSTGLLEAHKINMLKFFTVDSNIFMGITALLFAIDEIKILKGKIESIPTFKYVLKLMSTGGVALTFFTVFLYLGPIAEGGIYSMLLNSNLFYHLIIPVLSMLTFVIFEKTEKLNIKHCLYGVIPSTIYSIVYSINVFTHTENGKVSTEYDWYCFVQKGVWTSIIVIPLLLSASYLICRVLYKLNTNVIEQNK